MIGPSGAVRVMLATRPVDFRKSMDGFAMLVREQLRADPNEPARVQARGVAGEGRCATLSICHRRGDWGRKS